jgi:hypothetical protein
MCAVTLKADGAFVVTNAPADFFDGYSPTPAASEIRGTWKLRHVSEGGDPFGIYTGEHDYVDIDYTTAGVNSGGSLSI